MIEKKSCWKQYGKAGQTLEMDRYDKETPDSYRSVYSELFSEFGVEVTRKIHSEYKGRQVSFPKKLYTEQYIDYYVKVNSASKSVSEMAVQLEYTERNIRQRLQKSQKTSIDVNEETGQKIIQFIMNFLLCLGKKLQDEFIICIRGIRFHSLKSCIRKSIETAF